ncbi:MAG: sensor histidine kinase [Oscillospiraceae bacterium]|nr:sensor histidine kinase [Oscillospiraceae bacterium]
MIVADILVHIVNAVIGMIFLDRLSERKAHSKLNIVFGMAAYAGASFAASFIGYFPLEQLVCIAVLTIICKWLYNGHLYRGYALSVTVHYVLVVSEIIVKSLSMMVMGEDFGGSYRDSIFNHLVIDLCGCGLAAVILLLIYRLFTEQRLEAIKEVWQHYSFILTVFQLVAVVYVSAFPLDGSTWEHSSIATLLAVAFLIMSIMVVNFFVEICNAYKREKQMYALRSDYYAVKEQLEVQYQTTMRLKKIRHDIKNHLVSAAALIDKGDSDKARELLQEISDSADKLQPSLNQTTGNSLIDSIITYKAAVSEMRKIKFDYSLELLPEVSIELSDISSVISNLLDNALEATARSSDPQIEIRIFTYKNYLSVIVKNTYYEVRRENTGRLKTNKSDNDSHGLGMEIIREICERNGGVYRYSVNGAWFTANALMKM